MRKIPLPQKQQQKIRKSFWLNDNFIGQHHPILHMDDDEHEDNKMERTKDSETKSICHNNKLMN